jgi:hypothetical protein
MENKCVSAVVAQQSPEVPSPQPPVEVPSQSPQTPIEVPQPDPPPAPANAPEPQANN